jgi:hypothetical protein
MLTALIKRVYKINDALNIINNNNKNKTNSKEVTDIVLYLNDSNIVIGKNNWHVNTRRIEKISERFLGL